MTVLVTGGAGYIGAHVILALLERGERVVVLDDLSTGVREMVPREARLVVGGIEDRALVARLVHEHAVSDVIHLAASMVVEESIAEPARYYRNNTAGTLALMEALADTGVGRLIFSSTAAVYGETSAAPVSEDAAPAPMNPYGASKLMAERIVSDLAGVNGQRFVTLRYFNVAGADALGRAGQAASGATHLIRAVCDTILGRRSRLEVYGGDYDTPDGSCVRDFVHVSDIAEAHVLALEHLRTGGVGGVFNCGYGRGVSVHEVIAAAGRVSGMPAPYVVVGRRPGDPATVVADPSRLRATLGWRPTHDDLEGMIASALAWERRRLAAA